MLENIATILRMEGSAGIALAQKAKPDVILCDVMMPEMDGHAVRSSLRANRTIAGTPFIFLSAKGEKRELQIGMNLGADDYLAKPVTVTDLLALASARLECEEKRAAGEFAPDFTSSAPLETLGPTPREAEVLLWEAQGKSNPEVAAILGAAEKTIKVHPGRVFENPGLDSRHAATLRVVEALNSRAATVN